jgi:hypothetical protein
MIKQQLKRLVDKLPYVKTLKKELEVYKKDYPPGHYHSPIISVEEIKKREAEIFTVKSKEITGIELNENEQISLLKTMAENYRTIPFSDE